MSIISTSRDHSLPLPVRAAKESRISQAFHRRDGRLAGQSAQGLARARCVHPQRSRMTRRC